MSISIRDSIRWLPDPASEPTNTIVLTSPERRFVDMRVLKEGSDPAYSSLELGSAGISSSEDRNGVQHCTWRHIVHSQTRTVEGLMDEGDNFPQADGRTLETGRMVNPATGELADYEEVWTDLEPEEIPLTGQDSAEPATERSKRRRCVVLELEDEERGARGMAICLGEYYQAVVRIGDRFAAERWKWGEGKWQFAYKMGPAWTPEPEQISNRGSLSLGDEINSQDTTQRWTVIEIGFS